AALRAQAADDRADRGALAHAVAPEQRHHLAGADVEVEAEQHPAGAIAGLQAAAAQQRRVHPATSVPRYTACTSACPLMWAASPEVSTLPYTSTEMRSASWNTASMSCSMSRIAVSPARQRISATICCESSGPM